MLVALALADAARQPVVEVLAELDTHDTGLTSDEAARRGVVYGPNVLANPHGDDIQCARAAAAKPAVVPAAGRGRDLGATGDPADGGIIARSWCSASGLASSTSTAPSGAVAALARQHPPRDAGVARRHRPARRRPRPRPRRRRHAGRRDRRPGRRPAARGDQLECDEAVLTGESMPAAKSADAAPATDSAVDLPLVRVHGHGRAPGIGPRGGGLHRVGDRVRQDRGRARRAPAETAFQVGLREFSRLLVRVAAVLTVSIFVINVALSRPLLDALLFSLAIAIGITPQLLPAIVSVSLVDRLARAGASKGARQATGDDRGPRQHRGALHRQDRHPDRGRRSPSIGAAGCGRRSASPIRSLSGWCAMRRR